MQWITIVALFAASVTALPKQEENQAKDWCWYCGHGIIDGAIFDPYVFDPWAPFCPNVFNPYCPEPGRAKPFCTDGDANGCYFSRCRCAGALTGACDLLHHDYQNIVYDPLTGSCMDTNQRGIEYHGFANYCARAGGFVSGCLP